MPNDYTLVSDLDRQFGDVPVGLRDAPVSERDSWICNRQFSGLVASRAGRGAWVLPLLGRSALQLIENQFAMLLGGAIMLLARGHQHLGNRATKNNCAARPYSRAPTT